MGAGVAADGCEPFLLIKSVLLNDMQFEQGSYLLCSDPFLRCPGWRGGQVLGKQWRWPGTDQIDVLCLRLPCLWVERTFDLKIDLR
jgi:hypothetical protein